MFHRPRLRTAFVGMFVAGAAAVLAAGTVPASAADGHVMSQSPNVSVSGPTFVHDTAFTSMRTNVASLTIPGTSLSVFLLTVTGVPDTARGRVLGAHVHTRPCTAVATDSGPHYVNPAGDASKPLGAREVWLDLRTDDLGRGAAIALIDWRLKKGDANSVVIHAEPTNATNGVAGARLACTTANFGE